MKNLSLLLALLLLVSAPGRAEVDAQAAAQAPLKFYQSVNGKDYATAWSLLTEASKARLTALLANETKQPEAEVRELFETSDPSICAAFWDEFRNSARPDIYASLNYSYTGDRDGAHVISLTKPDSTDGNKLELLVKNEGGYKFALVESYNF